MTKLNENFKGKIVISTFLAIALVLGMFVPFVMATENMTGDNFMLECDFESFYICESEGEIGIWTEFGFTREEFNEFPRGLRKAMLLQPEEIGVSFNVPTREELEENRLAGIERERQTANDPPVPPLLCSTERRNFVGTMVQPNDWTCGPKSARNAISGFLYFHFIRHGRPIPSYRFWGEIPTVNRLSAELGTRNPSGTGFDAPWAPMMTWFSNDLHRYHQTWGWTYSQANWRNNFWRGVQNTISRPHNINLIVNAFGRNTIHAHLSSEYIIDREVQHFVTVFGFDLADRTVFIYDPNNRIRTNMYRQYHDRVANISYQRGVIW